MKPKWMLLIALVLCAAPYGCATILNEPAVAEQPRTEPVVRTGSRIPTREPAAVSGTRGVSGDDWMNDRRDSCNNCGRGK